MLEQRTIRITEQIKALFKATLIEAKKSLLLNLISFKQIEFVNQFKTLQ